MEVRIKIGEGGARRRLVFDGTVISTLPTSKHDTEVRDGLMRVKPTGGEVFLVWMHEGVVQFYKNANNVNLDQDGLMANDVVDSHTELVLFEPTSEERDDILTHIALSLHGQWL